MSSTDSLLARLRFESSHRSQALSSVRFCLTLGIPRFDGRTIRVDKASDSGPRGTGFGGGGGRGGGQGYGGRGGAYGAAPMPYGGAPQGYAMAPPNNMYPQQQQYGRGYPVQQQPYGAAPQGTCLPPDLPRMSEAGELTTHRLPSDASP
jgi:hypothetical protein